MEKEIGLARAGLGCQPHWGTLGNRQGSINCASPIAPKSSPRYGCTPWVLWKEPEQFDR
jgi:hypothetical protein